MPATITHNLFGKDVYNSLDEIVKSRIEPSKNIYNIFNRKRQDYFLPFL